MEELTIENFTKLTGSRFRVSHDQAARIALTKLGAKRDSLLGSDVATAAKILNAVNADGLPLKWVTKALEMIAKGWTDDMALTREQAFVEFINSEEYKNNATKKRPSIPDSVYLAEGLTLENFEERVEAAIGVKRRFRVSVEQHDRIEAGELTREQALKEVVEQKRASSINA